jgi:16S rRNA (cytidine1402-2'-O)-methyltransferase
MKTGRLYLIPLPLGQTAHGSVLPAAVLEHPRRLNCFVAETASTARIFLKALPTAAPLQQIRIAELNQHTPPAALAQLLAPTLAGNDLGLISEAGCPAIADPGADLVALAHEQGVEVVPLVGPSSILLALMASGLSGQSFAFHGYLPSEAGAREQRLRELEKESRQQRRTQIFIETPYRNRQLLASLLAVCAPATRVCIATELTTASELVCTRPIAAWRRQTLPDLNRRPTVFLLHA